MTPRTVDADKKREQILRGALAVFARHGTAGFKMVDVAHAAGVGKGTLYEYYRSKDDLIRGALHLMFTDVENALRLKTEQVAAPREQLDALVTATCEFFSGRPGRLQLMFDLWAASVPRLKSKPILTDTRDMYESMGGWLSGIITEGVHRGDFKDVDPEFTARVIMAILDGILFQAMFGLVSLNDPVVRTKLSRAVIEVVT